MQCMYTSYTRLRNRHYTSYTRLRNLHVQQGTVRSQEEAVQGSLLCTSRGLSPHCIGASVNGCGKSFVKSLFHEIALQYLKGTSGSCVC